MPAKPHSKRIITLTNQAPVRIVQKDWPIIASVTEFEHAHDTPALQRQAERDGDVDKYVLIVRRRVDDYAAAGETDIVIVHGTLTTSHARGRHHIRHGKLLEDEYCVGSDEIAAAIRKVAEWSAMPSRVADRVIALMPAETL